MTSRIILMSFLLFGGILNGFAQMKTASDIGIDEKLGSIVAMDAALKTEDGADVTLRRLIDKPVVLMFVYFRCPGICPVLINNMVEAVNQIRLEPGKDFRLIAISFDPSDTPELARQKKANYLNQLKRPFLPDAWRFLTGSSENTRTVADSTGFKYRQQGDMFAHPGAIIVLTPNGVISRYLYGTSFVPAEVELAIKEAAGGQVIPTVSKMLSFCYTYDPAGRRYVLNVTRLTGAGILLFAAAFGILLLRGRARKRGES